MRTIDQDCPLCCSDPCDPDVDAAVTRVHEWFLAVILKYLDEPEAPARIIGERWPADKLDSERCGVAVVPGATRVKRKRAE